MWLALWVGGGGGVGESVSVCVMGFGLDDLKRRCESQGR